MIATAWARARERARSISRRMMVVDRVRLIDRSRKAVAMVVTTVFCRCGPIGPLARKRVAKAAFDCEVGSVCVICVSGGDVKSNLTVILFVGSFSMWVCLCVLTR